MCQLPSSSYTTDSNGDKGKVQKKIRDRETWQEFRVARKACKQKEPALNLA